MPSSRSGDRESDSVPAGRAVGAWVDGFHSIGVWVAPVLSVARTSTVCSPGASGSLARHIRQVFRLTSVGSSAGTHWTRSMRISTRWIPTVCAHATPAKVTSPAGICCNPLGVSIRAIVLMRTMPPGSPSQPCCSQYGSKSKVVSSSSVSHFVAETCPYKPGIPVRIGKPCSGGSGCRSFLSRVGPPVRVAAPSPAECRW